MAITSNSNATYLLSVYAQPWQVIFKKWANKIMNCNIYDKLSKHAFISVLDLNSPSFCVA